MSGRTYYRFPAGAAEFWVLDQRMYKSDPARAGHAPTRRCSARASGAGCFDTLAPLAGARSRSSARRARVFMGGNSRDGNWGNDFEAERELLLEHIRRRVAGTTIFLTGDTHLTGVYDADGRLRGARGAGRHPDAERHHAGRPARGATNLRGQPGVAYAGDENHFTLIDVRSGRARPAARPRGRHRALREALHGQSVCAHASSIARHTAPAFASVSRSS